ncbi:MAG: glutathione S-transferase family protein [Pseudomonadota bacterium]
MVSAESDAVLYHDPQSRGLTTLWMNEELRSPCTIELVDLQKGEQKKPNFLSINPMGKVPALVHGDVIVTEAAAICAYLADAFPGPGMAPALNDRQRGTYFRWMFFAPSCVDPMMIDKARGGETADPARAGHGRAEDVITALRSAVTDKTYILGDQFSAADVVIGTTIKFGIMTKHIPEDPILQAYVDRLNERPAARKAEEINARYLRKLGR